MTAAAQAILTPALAPEETPRRHLDIAPTRAQKRARPRIYAALIAVGGIGAILLAQLMMSIVLADGAYQIAQLQVDKRDLVREQHAASETLQQLSSTQNLIQNAGALGMVVSGNPVFLDVESSQALGVAAPPKGQIVGQHGNLVGNVLLADGSTIVTQEAPPAAADGVLPTTIDAVPVNGAVPVDGAASGVAPGQTVPGTIPSPTTR